MKKVTVLFSLSLISAAYLSLRENKTVTFFISPPSRG